jgi:Zn-dependent peptidase ImmA (M78 family)
MINSRNSDMFNDQDQYDEGDAVAGIPQPIVGTVLKWAIADAGVNQSDIDDAFGNRNLVSGWISETSQPNQGQLALLSRILGRPASFFFLPSPPVSPRLGAQYRKYAGSSREPGTDTIDGIRTAQGVQKTAEWIRKRTPSASIEIPRLNKRGEVEESAAKLRRWLNWSVGLQTRSESNGTALAKELRTRLENKQLLVLHLTLDEGQTRGFSLPSELAPLMAINTKDDYKPRIFSYLHELVHLSLGSEAVCNVHSVDDKVESFCNRTAAAFLMPETDFRAHVFRKLGGEKISSLGDLATVRSRYRVSLRAAAIRAEHLGLASYGLYRLIDQDAEIRRRGGGGVQPGHERTKPRVRVDQYGAEFIRTVESGIDAGVLRKVQAADILRISISEWSTARSLVASGTAG